MSRPITRACAHELVLTIYWPVTAGIINDVEDELRKRITGVSIN